MRKRKRSLASHRFGQVKHFVNSEWASFVANVYVTHSRIETATKLAIVWYIVNKLRQNCAERMVYHSSNIEKCAILKYSISYLIVKYSIYMANISSSKCSVSSKTLVMSVNILDRTYWINYRNECETLIKNQEFTATPRKWSIIY